MSQRRQKAASPSRPPLHTGRPDGPPVSRATGPNELGVGSVVAGKYRLVRELGHGGMGAVYKAENVAIGKVVALKLLHRNLTEDPIAMQRFEREARATVAIAHPHIVDVLDMGQDPSGAPFLVMEYVRGHSLKQTLRALGPLPVERVAHIAGQILAALGAAHRRGIIHRDLKPENILLSGRRGEPDFVKVVDFGISTFVDSVAQHEREADLTPTGLTMATPFYASPEQIRGANGRDPRVDIYAVGVLTYEMLSGRRPFAGDSLPELCSNILAGAFAPLTVFRKDVPPALAEVVRRALANKASDRYQLASDFAQALVPFGASPPGNEEPDPTDTFNVDRRHLEAPEPTAPKLAPELGKTVHEQLARALCGYFAERYGNAEVRQLLEALDRPTRRALAPKTCDGAALSRALLQLDRTFARGDRHEIAAAGRYFVMQGLRDKQFTACATPELFFSLSGLLWQRYFATGEARVTAVGRGYGRLELRAGEGELPGTARVPTSLVLAMLGAIEQGLRHSGGQAVTVRLVKASALGDRCDLFEANWLG
ncbi:MAG: Serine/threonine-protein kinase PknB [Myxococcaceae bacterium]|nr:Serine/threonine-protein kinase PknB [Myxococcaceae bacterium]